MPRSLSSQPCSGNGKALYPVYKICRLARTLHRKQRKSAEPDPDLSNGNEEMEWEDDVVRLKYLNPPSLTCRGHWLVFDIPWALAVSIWHSEGNSSRSSLPIDTKTSRNVKNNVMKSSQESDFGDLGRDKLSIKTFPIYS